MVSGKKESCARPHLQLSHPQVSSPLATVHGRHNLKFPPLVPCGAPFGPQLTVAACLQPVCLGRVSSCGAARQNHNRYVCRTEGELISFPFPPSAGKEKKKKKKESRVQRRDRGRFEIRQLARRPHNWHGHSWAKGAGGTDSALTKLFSHHCQSLIKNAFRSHPSSFRLQRENQRGRDVQVRRGWCAQTDGAAESQ